MFRSFRFVFRIAAAWAVSVLVALLVLSATIIDRSQLMPPLMLLGLAIVVFATVGAISYTSRVRLIGGDAGGDALANRQRRRIEVPFEAEETLDLVDAVIRELPGAEDVQAQPAGLRVRARVRRPEVYTHGWVARLNPVKWFSHMHNEVLATVTPGDDASTVTLVCQPEANTWTDWFLIDGGTNLENANALTQALTHRVAARRRNEQRAAERTATEKELSEARLKLLHAQIEPHFLYNTLASAQLLTRSDPPQADRMLGHLIQYLRNALPHIGESQSTLAEELERIRAYLEVLRVRMGDRLAMKIEVPEDLLSTPVPTMMLQPLVENAIKHGLEPKSGGGTIWILARRDDGHVAITVADDGRGFGASTGGTGIGLKNVRERLRLLHGDRAWWGGVANVPGGVSPRSPSRPRPARRRRPPMAKAVIAEDEALLRSELSRLLTETWPELDTVTECEDGAEAVEVIAAQRPDVAFLDIRMPGLSGLDVATAAAQSSPGTRVVFTTAYDQYAVDAFERGAVDYLLKPITADRLATTVERLKSRPPADAATLAELIRDLAANAKGFKAQPLTWITASHGRETRLVMVDDVLYFRADNKYTVAVTPEGEALLRMPLRELLEVLDPDRFCQIHRSTIVNLKAVASIVRDGSGRGELRLKQRPETLTVSQPFMAFFKTM